jgi:hypothetical protein
MADGAADAVFGGDAVNEERLERARLGEYEGDYSLAVYDLKQLVAEVKRLEAENTRLREAARWIPEVTL